MEKKKLCGCLYCKNMAIIVTFTEAISSNLSINSLYYLKSVTGLNLLSEILMTPGLDFKY